jgi:hypothetical protein
MPDIVGQDRITKLQRGRADQQVAERNPLATCLHATVESSRAKRDGDGNWLHRHFFQQLIEEALASVTACSRVRPFDSMCQFDNRHHRERRFSVSYRGGDFLDHLVRGSPSPLGSNRNG